MSLSATRSTIVITGCMALPELQHGCAPSGSCPTCVRRRWTSVVSDSRSSALRIAASSATSPTPSGSPGLTRNRWRRAARLRRWCGASVRPRASRPGRRGGRGEWPKRFETVEARHQTSSRITSGSAPSRSRPAARRRFRRSCVSYPRDRSRVCRYSANGWSSSTMASVALLILVPTENGIRPRPVVLMIPRLHACCRKRTSPRSTSSPCRRERDPPLGPWRRPDRTVRPHRRLGPGQNDQRAAAGRRRPCAALLALRRTPPFATIATARTRSVAPVRPLAAARASPCHAAAPTSWPPSAGRHELAPRRRARRAGRGVRRARSPCSCPRTASRSRQAHRASAGTRAVGRPRVRRPSRYSFKYPCDTASGVRISWATVFKTCAKFGCIHASLARQSDPFGTALEAQLRRAVSMTDPPGKAHSHRRRLRDALDIWAIYLRSGAIASRPPPTAPGHRQGGSTASGPHRPRSRIARHLGLRGGAPLRRTPTRTASR